MEDNIFDIFDTLTWDELKSIRMSNRFSRDFLKLFNAYKAQRIIKEFVPLICLIGVSYAVIELFGDMNRRKN